MKVEDLQREILLFLYEHKKKQDYVSMHPVLIKYLVIIETAKQMLIHLKGIRVIELKINDPITNSEAKLTPIVGEKYAKAVKSVAN